MKKREALDFYQNKEKGKTYVLELDGNGVYCIYLNNRISSMHSDLKLAQDRMKKYKEEDAN